jgi:hypothetical protein
MANANTLEGVGKMREEIKKAQADVKAQYRKAMLKSHPDRNADTDTTEAFKFVHELYKKSQTDFEDVRTWLDQQEQTLKGYGAR